MYQVNRHGYENCDKTEGDLLDITPLKIDDRKVVALYDKDLAEGLNLIIGKSINSTIHSAILHAMNSKTLIALLTSINTLLSTRQVMIPDMWKVPPYILTNVHYIYHLHY